MKKIKWHNWNCGDGLKRKESETFRDGQTFVIAQQSVKSSAETGFKLYLSENDGKLHEIAEKGSIRDCQAAAEIFFGENLKGTIITKPKLIPAVFRK